MSRPSRAATIGVKYTADRESNDESCSEKRHGSASSDEESATSSDESSSDEESDDNSSSESESELDEPGEDDWEERDAEQQDAEDGEDVFSLYKSSRDRFRAQSTLQNAVESASAAEIPVWSGLTEAEVPKLLLQLGRAVKRRAFEPALKTHCNETAEAFAARKPVVFNRLLERVQVAVRKINRSSTFKGRWTKALESVAFQRYATVMVVTLVVPLVRFWLNKAWRNVPEEVLWMVSEYADHTNKITDDVLAGCIIGLLCQITKKYVSAADKKPLTVSEKKQLGYEAAEKMSTVWTKLITNPQDEMDGWERVSKCPYVGGCVKYMRQKRGGAVVKGEKCDHHVLSIRAGNVVLMHRYKTSSTAANIHDLLQEAKTQLNKPEANKKFTWDQIFSERGYDVYAKSSSGEMYDVPILQAYSLYHGYGKLPEVNLRGTNYLMAQTVDVEKVPVDLVQRFIKNRRTKRAQLLVRRFIRNTKNALRKKWRRAHHSVCAEETVNIVQRHLYINDQWRRDLPILSFLDSKKLLESLSDVRWTSTLYWHKAANSTLVKWSRSGTHAGDVSKYVQSTFIPNIIKYVLEYDKAAVASWLNSDDDELQNLTLADTHILTQSKLEKGVVLSAATSPAEPITSVFAMAKEVSTGLKWSKELGDLGPIRRRVGQLKRAAKKRAAASESDEQRQAKKSKHVVVEILTDSE